MAVAFRATSTGQTTGSSLAISSPSPATGDVLVAVVAAESPGSSHTLTASGWTVVLNTDVGDVQQWTLVRVVTDGGTEPFSYTFSVGSAGISMAGAITAYTGVDNTTPVDASAAAQLPGGSTTPTASSVTTTLPNQRGVLGYAVARASEAFTPPAGATERAEVTVASTGPTVMLADYSQSTAGATGTKAATTPNSNSWVAHHVALRAANKPPNAPIPTSPVDGATVNRANPIELKATFSDPNTGDTPSASQWRHRIVGAAAWTLVEQGNPLQSYSIPAGLAAGDYEWQAAYADQEGVWGPFCSSSFFTAGDPPPGPTWLDPIDGQTIASASYEGVISIDSLDKSEWTLHADSAGAIGAVLQGPVLKTTGDLRSHEFSGLVNNTTVWWSVRIEDGGLWTTPVQIRTPVAFTPPPVPTLVVAKSDADGLVSMAVTNPAGDPAAAYNDIHCRTADYSTVTDPHRPYSAEGTRIATIKPVNSTFLDWLAASGVAYEYRAVAVAENGTIADSGWVPLDPNAEPTIHYGGGYGD